MPRSTVKPSVRPEGLSNEVFTIRATSGGVLRSVVFHQQDYPLTTRQGRAMVRRFAQRLLLLCDYWENMHIAEEKFNA